MRFGCLVQACALFIASAQTANAAVVDTDTTTAAAAAAAATTTSATTDTDAAAAAATTTAAAAATTPLTVDTDETTDDTATDTGTTSSESKTLVWVTITEQGGATTAVKTPYTQKFVSMYSTFNTPSSGVIGLGTIKGTVGAVKQYKTVTISVSEADNN